MFCQDNGLELLRELRSRAHDQGHGSGNAEYVCLESTAAVRDVLRYLMLQQGPVMANVFYLCLMLNTCISERHLTMIRSSSSKSSSSSKAVAAQGVAGVSGALVAAAAATGVSGAEDVPRYLAQIGEEGLPAAVVAELERIGSKWRVEIDPKGGLLVGEEKQKQFIKDSVGMLQVLIAAVPHL